MTANTPHEHAALATNELLVAALGYAARGWQVFPVWGISPDLRCMCREGLACERPGKHPITRRGLHEATTDAGQIAVWWREHPSANVAVRTGKASGLTVIDVDGAVGHETLQRLIEGREEPTTPTAASGSGDGAHLFFRYNAALETKTDALGDKVDCRNDGGYVLLAPSKHRSGGTYRWLRDLDTPLDDLPKHLTRPLKQSRRRSQAANGTHSLDDLRSMLEHVDPNDRDLWRMVGIVLGRSFERSAGAWALYEEWSARSDKFTERGTAEHMRECFYTDSLKQASSGDNASVGSIVQRAKEGGWKPVADDFHARRAAQRKDNRQIGDGESLPPVARVWTLAEMMASCTYVERRQHVAIEDAAGRLKVLALPDFRASARASAPVADDWMAHQQRITVEAITSAPGRPRYTGDPAGARAVNTWSPRQPNDPPPDWADRVQPLVDHLEFLIPVQAERERFIDWLAHIEQCPGVLPHHGYLFVATAFGIGRNWLASVLTRVWRGYVAASVDLAKLLDSQFNGRIGGKVLAVVDEIHLTDGGRALFAQAAVLRQLMTQDERTINHKYGPEVVEFNCCRWLLFSNHEDALPMPAGDRRFVVIANPNTPRAPDYYAHLYAALDDPLFIDSVVHWLGQRDIARFNPGAIPELNAAKRAVIDATTPQLDKTLAGAIELWDTAVAASGDLMAIVGIGSGEQANGSRAHFGHAMRRLGHRLYEGGDKRKRVTLPGGERAMVWLLREHDKHARMTPEEVAALVLTSRSGRPRECDVMEGGF